MLHKRYTMPKMAHYEKVIHSLRALEVPYEARVGKKELVKISTLVLVGMKPLMQLSIISRNY